MAFCALERVREPSLTPSAAAAVSCGPREPLSAGPNRERTSRAIAATRLRVVAALGIISPVFVRYG